MKKWAEWLLVAGALCMGMAGCGSEEKNTSNADAEQKSETASETREEGQAPEQTDTEGSEEAELQTTESDHAETGLTFADLAALQFEFCSGAGGWSTDFEIENLDSNKIKEPVSKRGFSMTALIFPIKWALTPFPPMGSLVNLAVGFNASLTPKQILDIYYYPNY